MQGNGGFRLVVRRGPQPNQVYDLNKDIVALGRDITNDIVINDPEVSRHHCRMTRTPTGYALEDLGSTNGTFVNGQRLTGSRQLAHGDMIGLGETVTLAYEGGMMQPPVGPSQQQTVVSGAPSPGVYAAPRPAQPAQPGYQPQPQQPPYAAPQYSAPAQPYAQPQPEYGYYDEYEEEPRTNTGRWLIIGCGCLVVLCIVALGVAALVIDTLNLWCSVPLVPDLFNKDCSGATSMLPLLLPLL